jgi:replicative DNA helicase
LTSLVNHSNSEAERAILGAILLDNTTINQVKDILDPKDFYNVNNKKVYTRMLELDMIDPLTLCASLRENGSLDEIGVDYIHELTETVTTSGVEKYAQIVKDLSIKRQNIKGMTNMIADLDEGSSIDELYSFYTGMTSTLNGSSGEWVNLGDGRVQIYDRITNVIHGTESFGIKTGFTELDKLTGGAKPGELWVIGAGSSHGKTTMATQIAIEAARQGKHVGFFSFEMNRETLLMYHASRAAGLDYNDVVNGSITQEQNVKFLEEMHELSKLKIDIYESSLLTTDKLVAAGTRHDFDLVLIDYLQRFSQRKAEGLRETITNGAKQSKTLAKELKAPVLLVSSITKEAMNRVQSRVGQPGIEGYKNVPRKGDLKESGDIEYEADTIILLTIPSKSGNLVDESIGYWIVDKQRTGPIGNMQMTWAKNTWKNF